MPFTDVEMAILAQLAYQDPEPGMSLYDFINSNKEWLKTDMGEAYKDHIEALLIKTEGKDFLIAGVKNDPFSGFSAFAVSTPDNGVVVSSRGTNFSEINDILTDIGLATSIETTQHWMMEEFVNELEEHGYDSYSFTGYSLGGNLATHGATVVDDPNKVDCVRTYNSPGFNDNYWLLNAYKFSRLHDIVNYENEYDYVSSVMDSPGETVILESAFDGNHLSFADHSMKNFGFEDGEFKENASGEKSIQTILGTIAGELGQDIGNKISRAVFQKIVNEIIKAEALLIAKAEAEAEEEEQEYDYYNGIGY